MQRFFALHLNSSTTGIVSKSVSLVKLRVTAVRVTSARYSAGLSLGMVYAKSYCMAWCYFVVVRECVLFQKVLLR